MQLTDTIADYLTRVRNANSAKHESVTIPASNTLKSITKILFDEGYIAKYDFNDKNYQGEIVITLKYNGSRKEQVIKGLKRISKPGLRIYAQAENLPRVLKGLGIAIISTSKGIMTDKQARRNKIGGEVLAYIW